MQYLRKGWYLIDAAGLRLGMTGGGKQKVKELDEKVREKKKEIVNQSPILSWTGEANYTSDGLDPETGSPATTFIYRVKYTDADNDVPSSGYPKVHIKKGGAYISGSPFAMTYVSGTYTIGAIYTYQRTLSAGTNYTYHFEAKDSKGANATGEPTSPKDAPDVTMPTILWTSPEYIIWNYDHFPQGIIYFMVNCRFHVIGSSGELEFTALALLTPLKG